MYFHNQKNKNDGTYLHNTSLRELYKLINIK